MNRILYIHIGAPKTGTTALQHFLSRNRKALRTRGFCYPGSGFAHFNIGAVLPKGGVPAGIRAEPYQALPRLLSEIQASGCHTSVLSSEYLIQQGNAEIMRELIPRSLPVRIVYYARRQDELIESLYNQWQKSSHVVKKRLDEVPLEKLFTYETLDHLRVITPWAESFGRENIIVRCYENQSLRGDIVQDFVRIIGLSLEGDLTYEPQRANVRTDPYHSEFIRLCDRSFPHDPAVVDFISVNQLFANSRLFSGLPQQSLLSPRIRNEILDHYEESNRTVAREYLGRADGRLFYEPRPNPDAPFEPFPGLSVEDVARIMYEMLDAMDRQQELIEPLVSLLGPLNRVAGAAGRVIPVRIRKAIVKQAAFLNR